MMRLRLPLAIAGIALGLFGVFRLLTEVPADLLVVLLVWLIAALIIHDGIVSPLIVAAGWCLARLVPPRARRYVQFTFIVAAMLTVVAIPLIYREDTQPRAESMLLQNYVGNLTLLIALVAALSLLAYAIRVARDNSPTSAVRTTPPTE
ncbi:MAG: hypothetical protein ABI586_07275 [Candidatus Nanopelagicales bacterium]